MRVYTAHFEPLIQARQWLWTTVYLSPVEGKPFICSATIKKSNSAPDSNCWTNTINTGPQSNLLTEIPTGKWGSAVTREITEKISLCLFGFSFLHGRPWEMLIMCLCAFAWSAMTHLLMRDDYWSGHSLCILYTWVYSREALACVLLISSNTLILQIQRKPWQAAWWEKNIQMLFFSH